MISHHYAVAEAEIITGPVIYGLAGEYADGHEYTKPPSYNGTMYVGGPVMLDATRTAAFIFTVGVAQGASIASARIGLVRSSTLYKTVDCVIYAQSSDNAPLLTTSAYNITSRGKYSAPNAPWVATLGALSVRQYTPSLTALVQTVVNRPGWVAGNKMCFLFYGQGTASTFFADYGSADEAILEVEVS